MPVLTAKRQKHRSTMVLEPTRTERPKVHIDKARDGISPRISEMIDSLPQARKEKVLAIRQKLDSGRYGIEKRLNIAADRLIEELITKRM
jgi:hypothetical protein